MSPLLLLRLAAPLSACRTPARLHCRSTRCTMSPVAEGTMGASGSTRGAFILLEGVDRAGKTTQCQKLVEHLKEGGIDAEMWRYPDRTTAMGKMIDSYLKSGIDMDDGSIHLLFSANRWEKRAEMIRKLQAGTTLIVDRYSYSGVAFTAAKHKPGFDRDWCKAPERGLPAPDALMFLTLPPDVAAARGGFGEERYEKDAFQKEVLAQFEAMMDDSWSVVDASGSVDEVQEQCRRVAKRAVDAARGGAPMRQLWDLGPLPNPGI